ncbi:epipeptide YydF family RiPP [Staphylococcus equorum]|uniref:epipeptide YydF family RiPP n=1 Tax=Staphylococcus equorum TaxID=246432 RepID=UPI001867162F|nr:epipeptide YydF family RiPP [Staphylococcus equorum]
MKENLKVEKQNKKEVMKDLEFKTLINDSQKLANVNDLWYFVKSKQNRWVVGSGH